MSEATDNLSRQDRLANTIVAILDKKNAKDIEKITVEGKTVLADYFIVATAGNTTHIKSLADEIAYELKEQFSIMPNHIEGEDTRKWILLDYGDVVVNLFLNEERSFYSLEKLWAGIKRSSAETRPDLSDSDDH